MQIVYADGSSVRELELAIEHPDASVADLAAALGAPQPELRIDGRLTQGDVALSESGLVAGSTVQPVAGPRRTAVPAGRLAMPAGAVVVVRVVGGLAAGMSVPLGPGAALVGRGAVAVVVDDPAVSREHCRLDVGNAGQVTVTDLGSRNGTDVNGERLSGTVVVGPDDVVSLGGAAALRVLPISHLGPVMAVDPVREVRPGGTIPFTRAPRAARHTADEPLSLPVKPIRRRGATFSVSMMLGPLLMAGVIVALTKDPRFAAFAALTPIMFFGNYVEERTKGRVSMRRRVRDFAAELEELRRRLAARRAAEINRRLAASPDPAEAVYLAEAPGLGLWERRLGAAGFMELSAGTATLPWAPPLRTDPGADPGADMAPEVSAALNVAGHVPSVPVPVSLTAGGVIGLQGYRGAALAVARSLLCQAAVTSGPADVAVAVFTDADRAADWDWVKWLPQTLDRRSGGSARLLAAGSAAVGALARALLTAQADSAAAAGADRAAAPMLLVVVDGAALLEGRPCPPRELLGGRAGPTAGIVLTARLPALCTLTMDVAADGTAELRRLTLGQTVADVLATGMAEPQARRCARALARFEDPELPVQGAGLPDTVALLPLLKIPDLSGITVAQRWRAGAASLRATAVLGVSEQDVFHVDLDDDGPHGLIAGTTGSGKSELLRTLACSLAMGNDPEHLTFAFIDYKGGGALDECAKLPHSVGLVTDLDEQLGARALRCLEAELRHREQLLRRAGLSHIRDYQHLRDREQPDLEPMPRLVVVIDEFATVVSELPNFVDALVGIAQRGRSLGMHLIMATQRPAGSVNDAIKNNVKLRIALRLESTSDSLDVIDSPVAAGIGGRQWGRAFYRVSAREVRPVQTALSTSVSVGAAAARPVSARPFGFQPHQAAPQDAGNGQTGPTDLQRLVKAASEAFTATGRAVPRQPWPDPLPSVVWASDLQEVAARGLQTDTPGLPALALADDPDRQNRYPVGWDPGAGNLLLYGAVGSGTSRALAALALGVAARLAPSRSHLYILDLGAGDLAPLATLPHVGAYVGAAERERQKRFVRLLRKELDSRKAFGGIDSGTERAVWTVLIDNLGAFIADNDRDVAGRNMIDDLARVYADGPAVGIHVAVAADRPGAVPGSWASLTPQKLLLRLADVSAYSHFDLRRESIPSFVPGRAVVAATAQVIQVAWHGDDLAAASAAVAARWPGAAGTAPKVGLLPPRIAFASLGARARTSASQWWLPIGIGDAALEPVGLTLYEHEHALVAGPARSGRSLALCTVAEALLAGTAGEEPPLVIAFAPRRSPLRQVTGLWRLVTGYANLAEAVEALIAETISRPVAILVDDADTIDDKPGVLAKLAESAPPGLHMIVAGRADALRRSYAHWTQKIRDCRCGVLLIPDHDLDGALFGVTFPRTDRMAAVPGRGYLAVNGVVEGIQVALPGFASGSTGPGG
jgi:S-DNA-T family DNA segregation ATPase FtsK/SpoIIIE